VDLGRPIAYDNPPIEGSSLPPVKNKKATAEIVREVLTYLMSKPDAAETLTDIARWRLMQQAIAQTVEETQRALTWLVRRGLVEEFQTTATPTLFRLNAERLNEARCLLHEEDKK
jgi:hypothetical protein